MIDVVIPTYRGEERLTRCLAALASDGPEHHVYVVDDASGDGSPERVAAAHPHVTVLVREVNGGFAATADHGMRAGTGDHVVLLNDDAYAEPGFLAAIVEPLEADPRCGMVAALMVRPDGQEVEGLGIEADDTLAGFSHGWGTTRHDAHRLAAGAPLGPSGGAGAYRRAALEDVGFLDLNIHAYNEDLDLALRLRAAGWTCGVAPQAVVIHEGGQSFGTRSARQLWAKGHSRGYLLRKYGILRRPMTATRALVNEAATVGFQLLKDRSAAGARGRLEGWRAARGIRANAPADALTPGISPLEAARRRRAYGA